MRGASLSGNEHSLGPANFEKLVRKQMIELHLEKFSMDRPSDFSVAAADGTFRINADLSDKRLDVGYTEWHGCELLVTRPWTAALRAKQGAVLDLPRAAQVVHADAAAVRAQLPRRLHAPLVDDERYLPHLPCADLGVSDDMAVRVDLQVGGRRVGLTRIFILDTVKQSSWMRQSETSS